MDGVSAYSFASLAWLSMQAVPLMVWPSFICSMLTPEYQHASFVEEYLARSLGFAQLAIGLLVVSLSGALPLGSVADAPSDSTSPYANAVILVSTVYHAVAAFYSHIRFGSTSETAFALGLGGSASLAVFGLWCLLFAGDKGRVSKRTGADKRTSGFPFRNSEADKRRA